MNGFLRAITIWATQKECKREEERERVARPLAAGLPTTLILALGYWFLIHSGPDRINTQRTSITIFAERTSPSNYLPPPPPEDHPVVNTKQIVLPSHRYYDRKQLNCKKTKFIYIEIKMTYVIVSHTQIHIHTNTYMYSWCVCPEFGSLLCQLIEFDSRFVCCSKTTS